MIRAVLTFCLFMPLAQISSATDGELTDNIIIHSDTLGYALQYRVYTPASINTLEGIPTVYVADGQWYLHQGHMLRVLNNEIADGNLQPLIVVFVDNRNPQDLSENRRNQQFICNERYAGFYVNELVPEIDKHYKTAKKPTARLIMGLSFGALNAGCFGVMIPQTFANIGMHSPANDELVQRLGDIYQQQPLLPIKLFISVGTQNDNTHAVRKFRRLLARKGYDVTYKEVAQGHTWRNWRPLIDDLLLTFFKR